MLFQMAWECQGPYLTSLPNGLKIRLFATISKKGLDQISRRFSFCLGQEVDRTHFDLDNHFYFIGADLTVLAHEQMDKQNHESSDLLISPWPELLGIFDW